MGIGSAFQAVKQFVLAHKLAVGLTAAGATVTTVAYVKREALVEGFVTRSKKFRGLWAQQVVNETSITQLSNELTRVRGELQQAKDALENSEAERDALLSDKTKTAKQLGRLEQIEKEVPAFQTHIENLEKLNKQLELDLAASKEREKNQKDEIQRLMGQADRLAELETPEEELAPSARPSHAAVPTTRRKAKSAEERAPGHGATGKAGTSTSA